MTIICATDFSNPSTQAARVAARLAQRFGDSLRLVHVVEPPTMAYPELMADARVLEAAIREQAKSNLDKAVADLSGGKVKVDAKVLEGPRADAIALEAQSAQARMIVIGTHGRRAVPRFFLGSVAERTVVTADRPVLVVREAGDGFDEWLDGKRALRLVVAVDRSKSSRAAIEWLNVLRKAGPCDVTFVHVYWPPEQYTRLGLRGPRDVFEPDAETIRVIERDLREHIGELTGAGKVEMRVVPNWGAPSEVLAQEATNLQADLVVMGTHQRHGVGRLWLGSTTHGTLRAVTAPVLCVPARLAAPYHGEIPRVGMVIAATDLSELGNAAIPHAYAMLGWGGGLVQLCHVHERAMPSPIYSYEAGPQGDLSPTRKKEIEDRLAALIPPDAEKRGIRTRIDVVDAASPAEGLLQTSRRLGADAICIGSHGRSGAGRAVLGSVADAIVRGAETPVLVVRRPKD